MENMNEVFAGYIQKLCQLDPNGSRENPMHHNLVERLASEHFPGASLRHPQYDYDKLLRDMFRLQFDCEVYPSVASTPNLTTDHRAKILQIVSEIPAANHKHRDAILKAHKVTHLAASDQTHAQACAQTAPYERIILASHKQTGKPLACLVVIPYAQSRMVPLVRIRDDIRSSVASVYLVLLDPVVELIGTMKNTYSETLDDDDDDTQTTDAIELARNKMCAVTSGHTILQRIFTELLGTLTHHVSTMAHKLDIRHLVIQSSVEVCGGGRSDSSPVDEILIGAFQVGTNRALQAAWKQDTQYLTDISERPMGNNLYSRESIIVTNYFWSNVEGIRFKSS